MQLQLNVKNFVFTKKKKKKCIKVDFSEEDITELTQRTGT